MQLNIDASSISEIYVDRKKIETLLNLPGGSLNNLPISSSSNGSLSNLPISSSSDGSLDNLIISSSDVILEKNLEYHTEESDELRDTN